MKKNAALLFTLLTLASRPAFAADKQHLQMMAEIRLLQEQQQQLQQLIGGLQDTLKSLNTKLDDQTTANRKAMADQTLAVNNINDNVRVLREKTDETNVRISSVSQELEGLRQSIAAQPQVMPSSPPQPSGGAPSGFTPDNLANPGGGGPPTQAPVVPPGSAQRMARPPKRHTLPHIVPLHDRAPIIPSRHLPRPSKPATPSSTSACRTTASRNTPRRGTRS
jgi:hypothetical protein